MNFLDSWQFAAGASFSSRYRSEEQQRCDQLRNAISASLSVAAAPCANLFAKIDQRIDRTLSSGFGLHGDLSLIYEISTRPSQRLNRPVLDS
jgi:hypothetical protein